MRKNCLGVGKNSEVEQERLGFIRRVKSESTLERGGQWAKKTAIILASRGSALALAQTRMMSRQCQIAFPNLEFEIKIIKTTGDKLQTASLSQGEKTLPKGLFTKELEVALTRNQADMAVHSL